ncbi:Asparagine synthetase domain-containing protein [Blattella germanica]|nr:Asparagine synthetase domain-containing protein [Blattella germanica]
MCGIYCFLCPNWEIPASLQALNVIDNDLKFRGPNGFEDCELEIGNWTAKLAASILWMQGPQPTLLLKNFGPHGNILLWNGDVLKGQLRYTTIIRSSQLDCQLLTFDLLKPVEDITDLKGLVTLYPWSDVSLEELNIIYESFPVDFIISDKKIQSPLHSVAPRASLNPDHLKNVFNLNSLMQDLQSSEMENYILKLLKLLKTSVKVRVETQQKFCRNCIEQILQERRHFGGLDSTILAAIANEFVPKDEPIDLFNVAFHKTPKAFSRKERKAETHEPNFNVPDRLSGISAVEQLRTLFPERINVTEEELTHFRKSVIADLIYPLNTVLDDSLGCAVWFASRRQGFIEKGESFVQYTSPVRAISKERSTRKFIIFTGYVARCYPTEDLPPGYGDKLLLRLVAWRLGLTTVAKLKKRAMQFGCKIANRNENGADVSERLH